MTRHDLKIRTQQAINAIRVFKEKDYGWSQMEKMLYEILIELDDSDWQIGEPTKEGWYLLQTKETIPFRVAYMRNNQWLSVDDSCIRVDVVIAWQKIEEKETCFAE